MNSRIEKNVKLEKNSSPNPFGVPQPIPFVWERSGSGSQLLKEYYWNQCFDKGRIKNFVLWFLLTYGENKTVQLVEQLKNIGFYYATKAGISLGMEDLKIPPKKVELINTAENITIRTVNQYNRGEITGVERYQRLINTWHQTSESLKQEVIDHFESTDILNPVYMMAFSGARGNISQVRQLVGMRGLMADPQGQIIDFPIRSNFREGLTLTEYIISSYGARKGIVDTALRTATAGYLTRRLVDVAQHVIISMFDCGTRRGIFLTNMKEGNKTIHSLQTRLVGRVLARDLININVAPAPQRGEGRPDKNKVFLKRNVEISYDLAYEIAKKYDKVFVRSSLTCETSKLICQLCYGWSLAQGNLVSIGEAVGVVAGQSIGEPGTQLTMRTFHTGGVFTGDISDQIRAPFNGIVEYQSAIPGTLIRTPEGNIAFLTKQEGSFTISDKNNKKKLYKIPFYTLLFIRHGESVVEKEIIAQISTISNKNNATDDAELTIKSEYEGQFFTKSIQLNEKLLGPKSILSKESKTSFMFTDSNTSSQHATVDTIALDKIYEAFTWGYAWILTGKIYQLKYPAPLFPKIGDFINQNSILHGINWSLNINNTNAYSIQFNKLVSRFTKKAGLPFGLGEAAAENTKNLIVKNNLVLWNLKDVIYKKYAYRLNINTYTGRTLSFDFSKDIFLFPKSLTSNIHKKNAQSTSNWFPNTNLILEWYPNTLFSQTGGLVLLSQSDSLDSIVNFRDTLANNKKDSSNAKLFANVHLYVKRRLNKHTQYFKTFGGLNSMLTNKNQLPHKALNFNSLPLDTTKMKNFFVKSQKIQDLDSNTLKNLKKETSLLKSGKLIKEALPGTTKIARGKVDSGEGTLIRWKNTSKMHSMDESLALAHSKIQTESYKIQSYKQSLTKRILFISRDFKKLPMLIIDKNTFITKSATNFKNGRLTSQLNFAQKEKDQGNVVQNLHVDYIHQNLNCLKLNRQATLKVDSILQNVGSNSKIFKLNPLRLSDGYSFGTNHLLEKNSKLTQTNLRPIPSPLWGAGEPAKPSQMDAEEQWTNLNSFIKCYKVLITKSQPNLLSNFSKRLTFSTIKSSNFHKKMLNIYNNSQAIMKFNQVASPLGFAGPFIRVLEPGKAEQTVTNTISANLLSQSLIFASQIVQSNKNFSTISNLSLFLGLKQSKPTKREYKTLLTFCLALNPLTFKKHKSNSMHKNLGTIFFKLVNLWLPNSNGQIHIHKTWKPQQSKVQKTLKNVERFRIGNILYPFYAQYLKNEMKKTYLLVNKQKLFMELTSPNNNGVLAFNKYAKNNYETGYQNFKDETTSYERFNALFLNPTIFMTDAKRLNLLNLKKSILLPSPLWGAGQPLNGLGQNNHINNIGSNVFPLTKNGGKQYIIKKNAFLDIQKGWVYIPVKTTKNQQFDLSTYHQKNFSPGFFKFQNISFENSNVFVECLLKDNKSIFFQNNLTSIFTTLVRSRRFTKNKSNYFGPASPYPSGSIQKNVAAGVGAWVTDPSKKSEIYFVQNKKSRFYFSSKSEQGFGFAEPSTVTQFNQTSLIALLIQPIKEYNIPNLQFLKNKIYSLQTKDFNLSFFRVQNSYKASSYNTKVYCEPCKNWKFNTKLNISRFYSKKYTLICSRFHFSKQTTSTFYKNFKTNLLNKQRNFNLQSPIAKYPNHDILLETLLNPLLTSQKGSTKVNSFREYPRTLLKGYDKQGNDRRKHWKASTQASLGLEQNLVKRTTANMNFTKILINYTTPYGFDYQFKTPIISDFFKNEITVYEKNNFLDKVSINKTLNMYMNLTKKNYSRFTKKAGFGEAEPEGYGDQKLNKNDFITNSGSTQAKFGSRIPSRFAEGATLVNIGEANVAPMLTEASYKNFLNVNILIPRLFETSCFEFNLGYKLNSKIFNSSSQNYKLKTMENKSLAASASPSRRVAQEKLGWPLLSPAPRRGEGIGSFTKITKDIYNNIVKADGKTCTFYNYPLPLSGEKFTTKLNFAKTYFYSPFIGEIVYTKSLVPPVPHSFGKQVVVSRTSMNENQLLNQNCDNLINKTSNLSCLILTKSELTSFYYDKHSLFDNANQKQFRRTSLLASGVKDNAISELPKNIQNRLKPVSYSIKDSLIKLTNMSYFVESQPLSQHSDGVRERGSGQAELSNTGNNNKLGALNSNMANIQILRLKNLLLGSPLTSSKTLLFMGLKNATHFSKGFLPRTQAELGTGSAVTFVGLERFRSGPHPFVMTKSGNLLEKDAANPSPLWGAGVTASNRQSSKPVFGFDKTNTSSTANTISFWLGNFYVNGDRINASTALKTSGQIIHLNKYKITLRRGQPIYMSPKAILHKFNGDFIDPKSPVITLSYQRLKTGDIIQGIPKVEQFFESRTTKRGRLFMDSLPNLLKGLFKRYSNKFKRQDQAVRQSFYKIQQIIVDGVQRVYKSQGVTIADKHLEVIVKQMTSKVRILDGGQTGFFAGEIVDLEFVEKINSLLMKKITYEPIVLGITKASLEVDSFLSAASFQQTTRVLSKSAIYRKKDFLKGLKENVILGNLIPAGTGYLVYLDDIK